VTTGTSGPATSGALPPDCHPAKARERFERMLREIEG